MFLYTCPAGTHGGSLPGPSSTRAAGRPRRSTTRGTPTTSRRVGGFKSLGFTRRGKRDRIRELTGQEDVPVLVLNDGRVVTGHQAIVDWAREHPV